MTSTPPNPYRVMAPNADQPLRQCEILTNVIQSRRSIESIGGPEARLVEVVFDYAVILTQDCDLEQDYHVRFPPREVVSDKLLDNVLLADVRTADDTFSRVANSKQKEWDRLNISKNKNERFHFLQKVEPNCDWLQKGLPELVLDFKRCFSVPIDELYRRIELGETLRRCVLLGPYLEHLSSRSAYFLSRVALPSDHVSE